MGSGLWGWRVYWKGAFIGCFTVGNYGSPVDGPKDPWPRVLSLPGAHGGFVGDPTSLARDNINNITSHHTRMSEV